MAALNDGYPRQPWMHDMNVLVYAPAQLWADRDGKINGSSTHAGSPSIAGFYVGDTRIISDINLDVNGEEPVRVAWNQTEKGRGLSSCIVRNIAGSTVDPCICCEEERVVSPDGLAITVTFLNSNADDIQIDCSMMFRIDMSNMQEIKGGSPSSSKAEGRVSVSSDGTDSFEASCNPVAIKVHAPHAAIQITGTDATVAWNLVVPARGEARVSIKAHIETSNMVVASAETECPWKNIHLTASDTRVQRWVKQSLLDLDALRMGIPGHPDNEFLAAGAPWFFTLFGRDSLWAARFMLPLTTRTAMGTLRTLARFQATERDETTNADPGKIMHELRAEPLVSTGAFSPDGMSLPPLYYGTIDATPLWITLLAKALEWGAPDDQVENLLPNLQAALAWLRDYGDCDGDGFLEYLDRSGQGLSNQGWKDSGDSIRWHDGRIAHGPIALCEVQGYAYQAAMLGADVLDHFHAEGSDEWRDWAARLKTRFNETFWVHDENGRYPAVALDADKLPVDSLTSNIGHLLGTGILDKQGIYDVVTRLSDAEMLSRYGIRTMSSKDNGFWPQSYHCGSIWAHDSAIVMLGMYEEGYVDEALRIAEGLVNAAESFGYQIPELYSGESFEGGPSPYPAACHPQAWSASSSVAVVSVLLGIKPDGTINPADSPLALGLNLER